jgi:outer membrane receptor protein involved in Fe transport
MSYFGHDKTHAGWLIAAVLLVFMTNVQGQEKPAQPPAPAASRQEVIITGSRIARPELDRLEPTTTVDSSTFDKRGYADIGQALGEIPGFGVQPSSSANVQSPYGIGQSFVDLYSLGSQRTLTLVNGRRFVSSNTASLFGGAVAPGQQVDLNVIPTKLIDRVETISVGGAPIYGADAISGTVNIILKKNYQGLDVDAQSGISDHGDAFNWRVRALGGVNFAGNRGNIIGVAEFSKSNGLVGTERKNYNENLGFIAPLNPGPYKTVLTADQAVSSISTSGVPYVDDSIYLPGSPPSSIGITNAQGQPLAFAPGSSALQPYNLGQATGNPIFWQGGDGIRLSQFTNLLATTEHINTDLLGSFALTDRVSLFWEGWFSEGHARNLITQPYYSSNLFGPAGTTNGAFKISVNNPFLSSTDRATIQNALNAYAAAGFPAGGGASIDPDWSPNFFYMNRANTDIQSGAAVGDQVVTRGVVGVNGDFSFGTREYNWEIALNYGYSRDRTSQPAAVFQNLQNALNSVRDSSGQIVCSPNQPNAPFPTQSGACAPLNPFGLGAPSAAAVAYITHLSEAASIDTQRDVTANINGPIFALPAGEWKFAAGFENRRESALFAPDSFLAANPPAGSIQASAVEGAYRTNELYAETLIPIFEPKLDIPMLHQLELEGAVRRVDNSIAGNSVTYTEGLRWAPVQDVLFRGNRTKSIRAPAITELFLAPSLSNEFANDPCDHNFVTQGTSPAIRRKNCIAAGIDPDNFTSNVVNATAQGITSGNTGLQSEKADAKTYGIVLRPRWVPRLSLSADYIDIKMANAIEQLDLVEILDACYDSPDYPNNPSCKQFTRNTVGQITGYHDGFVNAGLLHFQGVSATLDYTAILPFNLGSLQSQVNYLDTKTLVLQVGSAAPVNEAGDLAAFSNQGAVPKSRATISFNYTKGPFSWFWQGQYYSGMNFDNLNAANQQNILRVNPWWLINSTVSYDVTHAVNVRLVVNNVFNKEPPYPALQGTGGNFASAASLYFPGIIGRTYLLALDVHLF